jgi:outer membrane protein assembly factor BamB
MQSLRSLRRGLSAVIAASVFVTVVAVAVRGNRAPETAKVADQPFEAAPNTWPMFAGNIHRNFVNTTDKNVPTEWSTEEGSYKNIKWAQDLGSKAYGGPVIADGKVFVGTNNETPRNPKIKGDKGILLCFRESDGKFLWQSVHDKLPAGLVNDWPKEGI